MVGIGQGGTSGKTPSNSSGSPAWPHRRWPPGRGCIRVYRNGCAIFGLYRLARLRQIPILDARQGRWAGPGSRLTRTRQRRNTDEFAPDPVRRRPRPPLRPVGSALHVVPDGGAVHRTASASTSTGPSALASNQDPIPRPLSLYVHIPFCSSPCFYCGCTKVITRNHEKAEAYLYRLHREIELQGELYDRDREVEQLHFGGGTPTFLTSLEIERLIEKLGQHFQLSSDDRPRVLDRARPAHDHDRHAARPRSRRLQSLQPRHPGLRPGRAGSGEPRPVRARHAAADPRGARVRLQLGQRRPDLRPAEADRSQGFAKTLDTVLSARPNRFAVYAYAHLPQMFKPQKQIKVEDLPTPETRLQLLGLTIEKLSAAGYVYIGMDHFALPDDELVLAQENGTLHRNFQGYSTRGYCDLVGPRRELDRQGRRPLHAEPEDAAGVLRRARPRRAARAPRLHDDARRRHPPRRDPADHVLRRARLRRDREAPRHRLPPATSRANSRRSSRWSRTAWPSSRSQACACCPPDACCCATSAMAFDAYLPSVQASGQRFSQGDLTTAWRRYARCEHDGRDRGRRDSDSVPTRRKAPCTRRMRGGRSRSSSAGCWTGSPRRSDELQVPEAFEACTSCHSYAAGRALAGSAAALWGVVGRRSRERSMTSSIRQRSRRSQDRGNRAMLDRFLTNPKSAWCPEPR